MMRPKKEAYMAPAIVLEEIGVELGLAISVRALEVEDASDAWD